MIRIRVATDLDILAMHRVRTSVRENRLADPTRVKPRDYLPFLQEQGRGWVAEAEDGTILGFAVADLGRANVWALFVDPSRRGGGSADGYTR
jgi:hypothetical protein